MALLKCWRPRRSVKCLVVCFTTQATVICILFLLLQQESITRNEKKVQGDLHIYSSTVSSVATTRVPAGYSHHPHLTGVIRKIETPTTNEGIIYEETLLYPKYNLTEPIFINEEDRSIFWKLQSNVDVLGVPSPERLIGKIYIIRNGTFKLPYDCGYKSNVDFVRQKRSVPSSNWFSHLLPLIIPDGWSYQHFQDGTMPKLMQVRQLLANPKVKLLIQKPRDKILHEFLDVFNISASQILWHKQGQTYGAENLIFTCNTPPLHPALWQEGRRALGAAEVRQTSWNNSDVVFITRSGCFNCGRKLLNFNATMQLLRSRYGSHVLTFNGPYKLNETIKMFRNAKIIIGTHGGGLSNVQFCPLKTTLVEIMPQYAETGRDFVKMGRMMWTQAFLLGQTTWRIPARPLDGKGNVNVNLTKLEQVLDAIDKVNME